MGKLDETLQALENITGANTLLKSNAGNNRENIYKDEVFEGCMTSDDEKKVRTKIRKKVEQLAKIVCENSTNKSAIEMFNTFYKAIYKVNDYSLTSVCGRSSDEMRKKLFEKALTICKPKPKTNK